MRYLLAVALAIVALPAWAQSVGERPIKASETYRRCAAEAPTMVDQRQCLRDELVWARQALEVAKEEMTDERSDALWRASVDHDCAGEYDLGGNSADMRRDACLIEALYDRADYLQRAGRW